MSAESDAAWAEIDRAMSVGTSRLPASVEAFDSAVGSAEIARAFGRTPPADEGLLRELEEAGYTASGARGVLQRLADGFDVETALSGTWTGFQMGRAAPLVESRAREVLQRHGSLPSTGAAPSTVAPSPGDARITAARVRVFEAHRRAWPRSDARAAEIYADAAVKVRLESAARNGWSIDQIVEALDAQAAAEGEKAAEARRLLTERRSNTQQGSAVSETLRERKARYDREKRR